MTQRGFLVDISRCSGCKGCQVACKQENNTRPHWDGGAGSTGNLKGSVDYRRVVFTSPDRKTNTDPTTQVRRFVSTACYHCDNPACLKVCPGRAITKRADGVVLIKHNKCIGCRSCQWACPYGAPRYNGIARKMQKCTMCEHRIAEGLKPACVQTCVTKALRASDDIGEISSPVAPPDGPPGGASGLGNQTYKKDAATYNQLLGTDATKHGQTGPNVGFVIE